jgi:beta-lactamase class A
VTAAAVLTLVDQGHMSLDRRVPYTRADLLNYAPITKQHVDAGFMTVDDLCAAATVWSDNMAANLLLGLLDGPAGWTRYVRSLGDTISRLDRTEPDLNTAIPGDPRDTTSPDAMIHNLDAVLVGKSLSDASRARLEDWMFAGNITGNAARRSTEWLVRRATSRDRATRGPKMTSGSSSRLGAPRSSPPFTTRNPPSLYHPRASHR